MEFKIIVSPSAQLEIEEIADFYFNININVLIQFNERLKEAYVYYEVETETYEKPKRTRKFYKNYISRRNK